MKHLIPRTHHNFAIAVDNDTNFRNIFGQTVRHQIKSYFRRLLNLRQQAEASVIGILQRRTPMPPPARKILITEKLELEEKQTRGERAIISFHTFK